MGSSLQVFYGGVLKLVQYDFSLSTGKAIRTLVVADWAHQLHKTSVSQIYSDLRMDRGFRRPTASKVRCLLHMIRVFEHVYPREKQHSQITGTKTFFVDPHRRMHHLLDHNRLSPDGLTECWRGSHDELKELLIRSMVT